MEQTSTAEATLLQGDQFRESYPGCKKGFAALSGRLIHALIDRSRNSWNAPGREGRARTVSRMGARVWPICESRGSLSQSSLAPVSKALYGFVARRSAVDPIPRKRNKPGHLCHRPVRTE